MFNYDDVRGKFIQTIDKQWENFRISWNKKTDGYLNIYQITIITKLYIYSIRNSKTK